jgi:FtsH-binding integral membrane protein
VTYSVLGAASLAFAVYLVVGQSGNYLRRHDYLDGIAWLWALSLVISAVALVVAWTCALAAATFDHPGPWVRWMLAATPLGRRS